MAVKEINGFKIFDEPKYKSLIIDSNRITECMDFYRNESFDGIAISRFHGYKLNEIDFLKNYPFVERISVTSETIELSGLNYLSNLKHLSLINDKQAVDFSNFPNLVVCQIEWNNKLQNIGLCKELKELQITKFNSKEKNLMPLSDLSNLEKLTLTRTNINSFNGLQKLQKLKQLEIYYAKGIENLSDINCISNTLINLHLSNCPNIKSYSEITELQKLYWLKLSKCGDIPSLSFIKEMPNLEKISFIDTNVLDGDLSPCIGLQHAGFTNKKHYSHTIAEMKKINQKTKSEQKTKNIKVRFESLKRVGIL